MDEQGCFIDKNGKSVMPFSFISGKKYYALL